MPDLQYDVFLSRRPMMTRDVTGGDNEDLRWVANSATFIYGEHDAVLADTFLIIEENERLIGWVKTPEPRPEPPPSCTGSSILRKYPGRANPGSLWSTARAARAAAEITS